MEVKNKLLCVKKELSELESLILNKGSFSPAKTTLAQIILFMEICSEIGINIKAGVCLVYAYEKVLFRNNELVDLLSLGNASSVYELFKGSKTFKYRDLIKRVGSDGGKQGNYAVYSLTPKGKKVAKKIAERMKFDIEV